MEHAEPLWDWMVQVMPAREVSPNFFTTCGFFARNSSVTTVWSTEAGKS